MEGIKCFLYGEIKRLLCGPMSALRLCVRNDCMLFLDVVQVSTLVCGCGNERISCLQRVAIPVVEVHSIVATFFSYLAILCEFTGATISLRLCKCKWRFKGDFMSSWRFVLLLCLYFSSSFWRDVG